MTKKIITLIASFILASGLNGSEMKIATTTKIYEVPLKFVDHYDQMIQEGKLIKSDTKVIQKDNVFQHENTIVIFPTDNKYENMNILIETIKSYAKSLDNIDYQNVERVLNLLKVESLNSELK